MKITIKSIFEFIFENLIIRQNHQVFLHFRFFDNKKTRFNLTNKIFGFKSKMNFRQNVDKTMNKNNNQFNFIVNKSKSTFARIMRRIDLTNSKYFKKKTFFEQ